MKKYKRALVLGVSAMLALSACGISTEPQEDSVTGSLFQEDIAGDVSGKGGVEGAAAPFGGRVSGSSSPSVPSSGSDREPEARQEPEIETEADVNSVDRLVIPSLSVDADLMPMSISGGRINPPNGTDAFWVDDWCQPGGHADCTSIIAFHSGRDGRDALGNAFITDDGTSTLTSGEPVYANGQRYEVIETFPVSKAALPSTDAVWKDAPGRLVLITCIQQGTGLRSVENSVVVAQAV